MLPKSVLAFVIISVISSVPAVFADSISIDIENSIYDVEYMNIDVELKSASADMDFMSLIFQIEVLSNNAQLEFNFDRDFFDAKLGSDDDDFFVLVDGDELSFEESKDDFYRNIVFSVVPGSEEIEIIGTQIAGVSYIIEKAESELQAEIEAEKEIILQEQEIISQLEEHCGEGTILEGDVCVIAPEQASINTMPLILGFGVAFGIAFVIVLILWGIGKKSNKELPEESN
jgi:hypothetical protein